MTFDFPPSIAGSKRLPCLDGFRCVSILLVLLSHSHKVVGFPENWQRVIRWLPDGGFGVQVFFVISGFLITLLLMLELQKNGRVSLRRFYIRRALRIVPAYAAFLVVLAVLQACTAVNIPAHSWFALGTYLVNYVDTPWIGSHVWSLSVEEQFYLLWPFIFWWSLSRRKSQKLLFSLILLPIIIAPVCRVIGYTHGFRIPFNSQSFLNHADSLAIGCLLALALGTSGRAIETWVRKYPRYFLTAGLLSIGLPLVATRLFILGPLTVPFGATAVAVGIVLLLSLSLFHSSSSACSWLNARPVALVGTWSYSIYLWQQIFCTPIHELGVKEAPWWLSFPGWLAPVFIVAIASFYLIEKPFLRMKNKFNI